MVRIPRIRNPFARKRSNYAKTLRSVNELGYLLCQMKGAVDRRSRGYRLLHKAFETEVERLTELQ